MRRLSLRGAFAILTVLAIAAVLVVGAPEWRDRWTRWRDQGATARITLVRSLDTADRALQREAQQSVEFLATGDQQTRVQLAADRITTDRAVRALAATAAPAAPVVRGAAAELMRDWNAFRHDRIGIDQRTAADTTTLDRLRTLTARPIAVFDAVADDARDGADLHALARVAATRAATADQSRSMSLVMLRVEIATPVLRSLREVPGTVHATITPARHRLTPRGISFDAFDHATAATEPLAAIARDGLVPFWPAADWITRAAAERHALDEIIGRTTELAAQDGTAAHARAANDLRDLALLIGAVVVALAVAGFVLQRRVRSPVRALTRTLQDSTAVRGPSASAPVPTELVLPPAARRARGEIGALAAAIAALDQTSVLAVTQAGRGQRIDGELSIKLARRNQPLLARQIALLDELEAREADPHRLQSLFQLDRLATRMRRNGESLLVLAGMENEREPAPPMSLLDIVRGAVAEIAHFARIDVVGLPAEIGVNGLAAGDLVHAFAELLENAATFSKPDTRVFVGTRRRPNGLEITIADEGIGIPVPHLDAFNELLSHPPMPGLDLSRALGLVVVARLCERVGATVTLRSAPDVGTSAVVLIPSRALVTIGAEPPAAGPVPVGAITAGAPHHDDDHGGGAGGDGDGGGDDWLPAPDPAAEVQPVGVRFTAVPSGYVADMLPNGAHRPTRRRARRRPSTGMLHRAPVDRAVADRDD